MKPSYHDRLDYIQFMMKIRQDNNVIDHIGLVYSKTKIKLSGFI